MWTITMHIRVIVSNVTAWPLESQSYNGICVNFETEVIAIERPRK